MVGVRLERSVCVCDVLWLCGLCLFVLFCGEVVMLIVFLFFLRCGDSKVLGASGSVFPRMDVSPPLDSLAFCLWIR